MVGEKNQGHRVDATANLLGSVAWVADAIRAGRFDEAADEVQVLALALRAAGRLPRQLVDDVPCDLARWVKAARAHAGLTLEQLGERIGRSKANVGHWENGHHEPSFSQVLAISRATGFPTPTEGGAR